MARGWRNLAHPVCGLRQTGEASTYPDGVAARSLALQCFRRTKLCSEVNRDSAMGGLRRRRVRGVVLCPCFLDLLRHTGRKDQNDPDDLDRQQVFDFRLVIKINALGLSTSERVTAERVSVILIEKRQCLCWFQSFDHLGYHQTYHHKSGAGHEMSGNHNVGGNGTRAS